MTTSSSSPDRPPVVPRIDPERLLDDLTTLRAFGAAGTGVVRPALSEPDLAARSWLRDRMIDAGLDATIDGVGNVVGRSTKPGPALLIGSHSDTQPRGGWLDGALGVVYGLEVARALAEDPDTADLAVDPVAWIDEESRFVSCLGSRAWCGLVDPEEVETSVDADGVRLIEALADAGLGGLSEAARPEPGRHVAYLEGHIEQGPALEDEGLRIGVVSGIVGSRTGVIEFVGEQNHAGTTPMVRRRDAGMALMRFGARLDEAFRKAAGERTVWTVGKVEFDPGAPSIIPGRARMVLQFRDPEAATLRRLRETLDELVAAVDAEGPVEVSLGSFTEIEPAAMDDGLRGHLAAAAAAEAPDQWRPMPSAAVHDAMFLGRIVPAGMLFIPSIGGVSHDFAEDSLGDDIALGAQVLATAATRILRAAGGR